VRHARWLAIEREDDYVVRLGGVSHDRVAGATAIAVPTGVGVPRIAAITRLFATTSVAPVASP
jgi:hypothetical protein